MKKISFEVGITIGMSVLTFIFAYLAINLFGEYKFIRMFMLTMCMWIMTATIGIFNNIAIDNSSSIEGMLTVMIKVLIAVSTLLTFIIFIMGIISAMNIWRGRDLDSGVDDMDDEDEEQRRLF